MTATLVKCIECREPVDTDGTYTDPLGRDGEICGPCLEHLDPKGTTKRQLLLHLMTMHGGTSLTSSSTKASILRAHRARHAQASERAARLASLKDTMSYLRETFGCKLDDGGFACSDDEWLAEHIRRHEAGEVGPTLL